MDGKLKKDIMISYCVHLECTRITSQKRRVSVSVEGWTQNNIKVIIKASVPRTILRMFLFKEYINKSENIALIQVKPSVCTIRLQDGDELS